MTYQSTSLAQQEASPGGEKSIQTEQFTSNVDPF